METEHQLGKTTIQLFWELYQLLRERRRGWVADTTGPLRPGPVRIMNGSLNNSYWGKSQKHKLIYFSEYDGWGESSAQQRLFSLNDWYMRWNVNGQVASEDTASARFIESPELRLWFVKAEQDVVLRSCLVWRYFSYFWFWRFWLGRTSMNLKVYNTAAGHRVTRRLSHKQSLLSSVSTVAYLVANTGRTFTLFLHYFSSSCVENYRGCVWRKFRQLI